MSEKINVTLNVQVVGGPKISASLTREVEAYDKVKVTVAGGDVNKEVDVQPSLAGQVELLMISLANSNQYGADVTYKVNDTGGDPIELDAPQVFLGKGAVGLLNLTAPTKLFLSNSLNEEASIEILVGRDATPIP